MKKIFYCGLFALIIVSLFSFQGQVIEVKRFYVAVNGKDANNGSIDQPFATLEQARNLRLVKKLF
ncbi:MAG: hypothetical protein EBU05_04485 [Chitinophagia bacterium]|nr:hypothetical protein [Chitinophagia bacterium]